MTAQHAIHELKQVRQYCSARAIPAIEQMRQGIRRGDLTLLTGGAEALVGLGDGLTPSGDDLLTGLYATLRMRAGPEISALIGRAIAQLPRLIRRTTPYGWSELWALTRGYLSEPLRTAIAALDAPDGGRPALLRLAGMGGSTGMDTLLGIGEAVQFLTDREDGKGSCTG